MITRYSHINHKQMLLSSSFTTKSNCFYGPVYTHWEVPRKQLQLRELVSFYLLCLYIIMLIHNQCGNWPTLPYPDLYSIGVKTLESRIWWSTVLVSLQYRPFWYAPCFIALVWKFWINKFWYWATKIKPLVLRSIRLLLIPVVFWRRVQRHYDLHWHGTICFPQ